MPILFHHPTCPLSRQVRIYLKELNIQFNATQENYWLQRPEFLKINPSGNLPVLVDNQEPHNNDPIYVLGIYPIIEHLIERHENFYFMPQNLVLRSHIRNYLPWFNDKFYREVTKIIVDEKMIRLLMRAGAPRSNFIKIAKNNLNHHLKFLSNLLDKNLYITSEQISCADIAAASNISVLDYFGEINWDNWPQIKHWYSIIKSRPSFRPILQDKIAGFSPSKEYANLDF